jgi:hypothetical protein
MHLSRFAQFVLPLSAVAFTVAASAGVVDPAHTIVPVVVVASPDGSIVTQVIARDAANNPVPDHAFGISFDSCPALDSCAAEGVCAGCRAQGSPLVVFKSTDAAGVAAFALRLGGGGCSDPPYVTIFDTFYFYQRPFAALDQDGDLVVSPADLAHVHALLGTHDQRADFDGDQVVTAADESILQAHMGAACGGATPARTRTWGQLKSTYR